MLAIGSAQFGSNYGIANQNGQVGKKEIGLILDRAKEFGIDTIDTAISYGDSEKSLGEAGIKNWKVVTKIPEIPSNLGSSDLYMWVDKQISGSLKRLNVESLYAVLLHRPDQLNNEKYIDVWNALLIRQKAGDFQKIGYSIYEPSQLDDIFDNFKPSLIQTPFNLIDQRIKKSGFLEKFHDMNIEVHSRSCFLQGLLLLKKESIPTKFKKWDDFWDLYHQWLKRNDISALEACLRYVGNEKYISKIVVGVDSFSHIDQIINILEKRNDISFIDFNFDEFIDVDLINPVKWNAL